MKKTIKIAALAFVFSVAVFSCKKNVSDAELTTQSTTVVAAYPGTSVEVKEGVAHLSGTFASQEEKDAAIAALKNVKGVKDVMDMATVAPASSWSEPTPKVPIVFASLPGVSVAPFCTITSPAMMPLPPSTPDLTVVAPL